MLKNLKFRHQFDLVHSAFAAAGRVLVVELQLDRLVQDDAPNFIRMLSEQGSVGLSGWFIKRNKFPRSDFLLNSSVLAFKSDDVGLQTYILKLNIAVRS